MIDFKEILEEFAKNTIADIRYNMSKYDMGTSNLAKSLNYEIEVNNVKIYSAPYFRYAEKGRGPGKVPMNFTEILETWIVSRGLKPRTTITEFANAIKWKTIKYGSYLYRNPSEQRDFIGNAIDENVDALQETVRAAVVQSIH